MSHNYVVELQITDSECMVRAEPSVTVKDCQLMSSYLVICHKDRNINCWRNGYTAKLILFLYRGSGSHGRALGTPLNL